MITCSLYAYMCLEDDDEQRQRREHYASSLDRNHFFLPGCISSLILLFLSLFPSQCKQKDERQQNPSTFLPPVILLREKNRWIDFFFFLVVVGVCKKSDDEGLLKKSLILLKGKVMNVSKFSFITNTSNIISLSLE